MQKYDLQERLLRFAVDIRLAMKAITSARSSDTDQLIRSSGSIGANYAEANDSLGKKDMIMRMKIARKEAKEARYWLQIIAETSQIENMDSLVSESNELVAILSTIIRKIQCRP